MLQLQRASAGSGKTYMLAKKFIEYYISQPDDSTPGEPGKARPRRLRPLRGLRESLQHILAITFTNKATNEMKLRIVEKLNALASWTPATDTKKVDYLDYFTEKLSCTPQELAAVCRYALKILLTDYGDFKVSTIDSFFQTVLRTFAYEADLDDTYQLELDSAYISRMGLDTTLDEIDADDRDSQGKVWVESMMESKAASSHRWNIFQKRPSPQNLYNDILEESRKLNKEEFKEKRKDLDEYFDKNPDFFKTFRQLTELYERPRKESFSRMRAAAGALLDAFREAGLDITEHGGSYLAGRTQKMAEIWKWDTSVSTSNSNTFEIPEFTRQGAKTRVFHPKKKNPHLDTPIEDHIQELAETMYKLFDEWRSEALSERSKRWNIYKATMPYVGLLQSVRENSRLFLTDSNTVELGETNSILNRIIGDSDTPFIYERLGSRLEHFLIDEFQDTSTLQWKNLYPLLNESHGNGNDNLIIGDAKQSIYRFRNADPSLITSEVPRTFGNDCDKRGDLPEENTNWRSSKRIVQFNNLFFRFFSRELGERMETLYSNTVQPSSHKADIGYVRVQLFKKDKDEEMPRHFLDIPVMISDMLDRGYRMSEIAVLVDTRAQGEQVIESIMRHNLSEDARHSINFISADSLKAGESPAVQTVVSILEAIQNGTQARLNPKEERKEKGAGEWSRLRADFSFFAMQHPDLPLSEALSRFLDGEYDPDAIRDMLAEMSTTVLPALVENIIQKFIPPHSRRSEAPFLTALQDMVVAYCETYTADIASFLGWWDKKGRHSSISSPEDADAVNIMTVHKSKGLEFRCVIVPYSQQDIRPDSRSKKEWLWVKPDLSEAEGIPQIPWIPVETDQRLEETIHRDKYREYLDLYMSDKVNMAYVAYTRAVDELYIFTPAAEKEDGHAPASRLIGSYLWRLGTEAAEVIADLRQAYPGISGYIPEASEITVDPDEAVWSIGAPLTEDEIEAGRKKKEGQGISLNVPEYRCGTVIPALIYSDPSTPDTDTLPSDLKEEIPDEQESEESRLYGELMHSIMERIRTSDDISRALLHAKASGHIGRTRMEELRKVLTDALRSVERYGWFEPGCRVLNERGIVVEGRVRRPDRVILRPDGTAVIIDYKFGDRRSDKAYSRQVRRYASALMKTGLAKKCEAYIWYVSLGIVMPCALQAVRTTPDSYR